MAHGPFLRLLSLVLSIFITLALAAPPFFDLPAYEAPPYDWVEEVHVVYKTHLDVGFTGLASSVCEGYFFTYLGLALDTAKQLRTAGGQERFIYTSDAWLLSELLDGYGNCTTRFVPPGLKSKIADAIVRGDIVFHAAPFTMYGELLGGPLYGAGLDVAVALANRFNMTPSRVVSAADVPGLSRTLLPTMAMRGIKAIHIGANAAVLPPAFPQVFRWTVPGKEYSAQDDFLVMLYGGNLGWGYGGNVTVHGSKVALVYNFTLDNSSPLTPQGVVELWANLRQAYPNAKKIIASTLDRFVAKFEKEEAYSTLPRLSEEMGDTWLYGTGADPWRSSNFRALQRAIEPTLDSAPYFKQSVSVQKAVRSLLKVAEHNWGLSDMGYLDKAHYSVYWSNRDFHAHRNDSNYTTLDNGWAEQRRFVTQAMINMLNSGDPDLKARTEQEIAALNLETFPSKGTVPQPIDTNLLLKTKYFNLTFSNQDARVIQLSELDSARLWADAAHPLFALHYQSFSYANYQTFCSVYTARCLRPGFDVCEDFSKLGLNGTWSPSVEWPFALTQWSTLSDKDGTVHLFASLNARDPRAVTMIGAANEYNFHYTFPALSPSIELRVQWRNKTVTRLPEATWLSFTPVLSAAEAQSWMLNVHESKLSPLLVAVNGSRHLHAVNDGAEVIVPLNATHRMLLKLCTLDAHLIAPGVPNLLDFAGTKLPNMEKGLHVNLHNNLWGTAFNQWYDEDASFRVALNFTVLDNVDMKRNTPEIIN